MLYDETQKAIAEPGVKERLAKLAIERCRCRSPNSKNISRPT